MTATTPPEPLAPVDELVADLGGQVLDTAVNLAPVAVPFVLAMTAIAWVMEKFGVNARIELGRLDRAAHAKEIASYERKAKRAAAKQRKWDGMVDEAYTENRRKNLRKRVTGSY